MERKTLIDRVYDELAKANIRLSRVYDQHVVRNDVLDEDSSRPDFRETNEHRFNATVFRDSHRYV
jgi:hypothetical protein